MDSELAAYRRGTGWLGRRLAFYASVDSTNDVAREAARDGADHGLVVIAEEQSAGRGRLDRRWVADAGTSLLVSMVFRPPAPMAAYAGRVPMACGLGLHAALRDATGLDLKLKWPNDLIADAAGCDAGWVKLAGMLGEVVIDAHGEPEALVVGIGINVNVPATRLAEVAPNAGSLAGLLDRQLDRVALLDDLLVAVEREYDALVAGCDPLRRWRGCLAWLGRSVTVVRGKTRLAGVAEDVDRDGSLLLRARDGVLHTLGAGDVSLRLD